jgi:hypothetical protein
VDVHPPRFFYHWASSPSAPSTSQLPDEEHPSVYRSSSISSRSSAFSTDSPYTPIIQPTPTPASYSLPLEFNPKIEPTTHTIAKAGEISRRPSFTPSASVPEVASSSAPCYQYVEQPAYSPEPAPHQPQYPGVAFAQHGFVGPDGLFYASPLRDAASLPHPAQEDSHPYPNDTRYFYS